MTVLSWDYYRINEWFIPQTENVGQLFLDIPEIFTKDKMIKLTPTNLSKFLLFIHYKVEKVT